MVSGIAIQLPQQYCGWNVATCFILVELGKTQMTFLMCK